MNGVSEALLEELLAQAKTQTQLLQKLARGFSMPSGGGGGGSGGAASAVASLGPMGIAAKAATGAFSILSTVVGGAFNIFKSLVGAAFDLAQRFADFGKQAVTAGVKLSDFYNQFESVPLVGRLFRLAGTILQVNEAAMEMYRSVSTVGATFGGSLDQAQKAAGMAGLTFDEFGKVIRSNSQALAMFAGNTENGATALARMNRTFMLGTDQAGRNILGLGVKFDEAAGFLSSYMGRLASTGDARNKSDEEVIKGAREYVFQLDSLARLTGIEREEADKRAKALRDDRAFNAYLAGLSENERQRAQTYLETMSIVNPEGLKQAQYAIMGLSMPADEYGQSLIATGQANELNAEQVQKLIKGEYTLSQVKEMAAAKTLREGENFNKFARENIQLAKLGGINLNNGAMGFAMTVKNSGKTLEESLKEVGNQQIAASQGSARAQAETELRTRDLGRSLLNLAAGVIGPLMPFLRQLSDMFIKLAQTVMPIFSAALKRLSDWLQEKFKEYESVFKKDGLSGVFEQLKSDAATLWDTVAPAVGRAFDKLAQMLKPIFSDLLGDVVNTLLYEMSGGILGENPERRELRQAADAIKDKMNALNERFLKGTPDSAERQAKVAEWNALRQEWIKANNDLTNWRGNVNNSTGFMKWTQMADPRNWMRDNPPPPPQPPKRHGGTIGMTGNWWEKETKDIEVQAGETVLTQAQLGQIVDTAGSNKLAVQVERLNSLTAQMLVYLKQTADNTAKTHRAASAMSGNAFVM